ncbi:MAG: hypothetical protein ACWIPJ_04240 [Polaribacter sp.]
MDRVELYSGGFPVTTTTFNFLQDAYANAIKALTKLGGDTFILEGVQKTGANISNGAIVYNGEYLPFVGGVYNDTVGIYETVQEVAYNQDSDNDGSLDQKRAYIQRYAKCGTDGLTSFDFADLKGFTPLTELSMPIGSIIMWSGADIPNGWALCNGANDTPNLTDRFIVGAGNDYNIGALGGTNDVTLTESQMPAHNHTGSTANNGSHKHTGSTYSGGSHNHLMRFNQQRDDSGSGGAANDMTVAGDAYNKYTDSAGSHSHTLNMTVAGEHNHSFTTNNKGGSQSHENRPPYYALAFIMFKGL